MTATEGLVAATVDAYAKRRRQYQAVFVDGPAKGRVQALQWGMMVVKFAEMPKLTARLIESDIPLAIDDIVYVLDGHYAPCGRGQFKQVQPDVVKIATKLMDKRE